MATAQVQPTPVDTRLAVRCRGVTKDFGRANARVQALRGIDLDVRPGEITLLMGPSGCGKTTLLSIIAGILDPTGGEVRVLGEDVPRMRNGRLIRFRAQNIGFIFQQFNLLPALTAAENAAVPLVINGWKRRPAVARAAEVLAAMNMDHRIRSLPSQLSGGEQQRVAIARGLVHEPAILVCDEPTSALDTKTGHTIMELLRDSAVQTSRAVIVVTHDARVMEFGNRIATMEDGRIVGVEDVTR